MQSPVQSRRIVGNIEDDRMGVIRGISGRNHMQDCAVIQDNCHKLEDIDGDQQIVRIVLFVEQRTLLHLIWEVQVPPKLEGDGVSSGSMQAHIAKGSSHWHSRFD